jgi:hypothetical protein
VQVNQLAGGYGLQPSFLHAWNAFSADLLRGCHDTSRGRPREPEEPDVLAGRWMVGVGEKNFPMDVDIQAGGEAFNSQVCPPCPTMN